MRALYRTSRPSNETQALAHERREIVARNLLSNIIRTKEHPTLSMVLEVARAFSLTLDGAHRLFGYELARYRELDLQVNGRSTHILEDYPFDRDAAIELPLRLGDSQSASAATSLDQLVLDWQGHLPIRSLESPDWSGRGTFYVRVGAEGGLGSDLPPGSLALVEPIDPKEAQRPNPRKLYLLQFGNGYRCCRCVVSRDRLLVLTGGRRYAGPQSFAYPEQVRIAGRIRMFAAALPIIAVERIESAPYPATHGTLVLPWEHGSLGSLLAGEYRRFRWLRKDDGSVREILALALQSRISARTERRYRAKTQSLPHVSALLQLSLLSSVRYTDALRAVGSLPSDRLRYSLSTLLQASTLENLPDLSVKAAPPEPVGRWNDLKRDFPEWPGLLSTKYPCTSELGPHVVRLGESKSISGLEPAMAFGSLLLLKSAAAQALSQQHDTGARGWYKPIYALRRGADLLIGHLARDGQSFAIQANPPEIDAVLRIADLPFLRQVSGVAIPL